MQTTVIDIKGMTCMGCVKSVKNVLERIPGVSNANVSLEGAQVAIQHDDAITGSDQLKQAIKDAGFEAV